MQVEGRAEIVALPDAMDGLVDYYRRVAGEHENWDDYRSAMQRERRVLLRVTLDRAGPDRAGPSGAPVKAVSASAILRTGLARDRGSARALAAALAIDERRPALRLLCLDGIYDVHELPVA